MASIEFSVTGLGEMTRSEEMEIAAGPNDWDLWLSMRGTLPVVLFTLNPPNLPFLKEGQFRARIIQMAQVASIPETIHLWNLRGEVIQGDEHNRRKVYSSADEVRQTELSRIWFDAEYDTVIRQGSIVFLRKALIPGVNTLVPV